MQDNKTFKGYTEEEMKIRKMHSKKYWINLHFNLNTRDVREIYFEIGAQL